MRFPTMMIIPRLLLVGVFFAQSSECDEMLPTMNSRLFPAAQTEIYEQNSEVLGTINLKTLSIQAFGPDDIKKLADPAIERFKTSLARIPDFANDYQQDHDLPLHEIDQIDIRVLSPDTKLFQGVEENYNVVIDDTSEIATLAAPTIFGGLHALETLAQLMEFGWLSKEGDPIYIVRGLPLMIVDKPSFVFRGLMIDTSRHYLPMNLLLKNLDAMAMNKLNVLHWHITDSQSFPWQTESYPEIAAKGAYHPKRIYTTNDIKTVIEAAYLRGITVIPEVDMPGHTDAIFKSHPEIMSQCPGPSEPLDPTNPDVYTFVETIYKDLGDLFPDEFVHVGGDEVNFDCWNKSKSISAWMEQHNMTSPVELYEYFETRLLRIVEKSGKTPIVWQEVFNLNLTITNNTIVDVWKGFDRKTIEQATNQSFNVIISGCWYLDHLDDSWRTFYECDPRNFTGNKELMLGGHASMWGERVDASNFVSRVWPRASGAAERLWTGDVSSASKNVDARIHRFRCRMVQQGFAAGPTGPGFCPHEVPYMHDDDDDDSERGSDCVVAPETKAWYSLF